MWGKPRTCGSVWATIGWPTLIGWDAAGAISGSFANPSSPKRTIKVNAVLLQNQTNAAGYFLGTNQSGAFLLENPEP